MIFSVLISEIVLRLLYREEEINGNYWGVGAFIHHDSTGYVHAPGYEGFAYRSDVFQSIVKTNFLSLRQEDLEQQLLYPIKLLILGDSFPFGLGVPERYSFPSLIKEDLNVLGVGIINGAQTGYSVEQERLFGVQIIQKLKPDIVILNLFAANDIMDDYYKKYLNIEVRYGYRLRKNRWMPLKPVDFLRTHSYLCMFIENNRNRREKRKTRLQFEALQKTSFQEVLQPSLNSIAKLRDYCEINNIVFGIVMIPSKSGRTPFDERLKVFFKEEKIAVMDLTSRDFGHQEYLSGDGHWNEKGHEKASQFLVPFVAGLLEK